ncbi:MAG: hypothetical protein M3R25_10125 [Bacteroidota bacterium]|nr:hypothetical protein [Bacteroidota bacterium]
MQETLPEYEQQTSLRDYVLKGKSYVREVFRYWYLPLFLAAIFGAYQLYKYFQYVPEYPANVTFMVDEDEGNSSSGLTGMLSQFGLGSIRPTRYNLDKILELSRSRRVVQKTLFTKFEMDGKNDFLANHVIRAYDLNPVAKEDQPKEGVFLFTHDSLLIFNRVENTALSNVYNLIIGSIDKPEDALVTTDYSEDTNVMQLSASTINEVLSLELANRMFQSLSDYYISKAIEKSLKTFSIISNKRDSIIGELRSAEYQLANFQDTHRGLLMRTDKVGELRLQREVTALSAMYGEVLKNTEVADFSLRNKTPFIQVIDAPILPIAPVELSLIRKLALGLLVGGIIGCALVVARRFFLDMMAPPNSQRIDTA